LWGNRYGNDDFVGSNGKDQSITIAMAPGATGQWRRAPGQWQWQWQWGVCNQSIDRVGVGMGGGASFILFLFHKVSEWQIDVLLV
jgi:hypothetical protein